MSQKKALLVGINQYSLAKYDLRGCVPDVHGLRRILIQSLGFDPDAVKLLLDRDATGEAIRSGISNLLAGSSAGDILVFGFSGHGTQKGFGVEGEIDGKNEALVPHDVNYESLITDDELNA